MTATTSQDTMMEFERQSDDVKAEIARLFCKKCLLNDKTKEGWHNILIQAQKNCERSYSVKDTGVAFIGLDPARSPPDIIQVRVDVGLGDITPGQLVYAYAADAAETDKNIIGRVVSAPKLKEKPTEKPIYEVNADRVIAQYRAEGKWIFVFRKSDPPHVIDYVKSQLRAGEKVVIEDD